MTTEEKMTSRELSEQLREAGAKQESERQWRRTDSKFTLAKNATSWPIHAAAFDCAELLERLPETIHIEDEHEFRHLGLLKYPGCFTACYLDEHELLPFHAFDDEHPAEALGKLYLWCLKEGHCEV